MTDKTESKFITYQDIADALGITKMAVSKALRNSPDISEETKKLVKEKADELGYIPNNLAKNLKSKKTNMIAVVFNSFHNPYFSIACYKIFQAMKNTEYNCQLFFCEKFLMDIADVKMLMINKYCGIVSFVEPTEEAAAFFKKMNIPFVLVGINNNSMGIDCVYTDDYAGGKLVAEYFISHNYKKALFVSDSLSETSYRRFSGFYDIVSKSEKGFAFLPCQPQEDMVQLAYNKIKTEKFDFVFCFSDSLAIMLLLYMEEKKKKDGVVIFGYDNLHKYYPIIKNIKSVDSNLDIIIDYACKAVIAKIQGEISMSEKVNKVFGVTLAAD